MWYSWSGTDQPEEHASTTKHQSSPPYLPSCFPTILAPSSLTTDSGSLLAQLPPADQLTILWRRYLKNVHPLVKLFFDWEIDPIVQKCCGDASSLSKGEQALVFAIVFIATLSLPDQECATLLSDNKQNLLYESQRSVEDALLLAEFATTSDIRTLQAFILYLSAMRDRTRPAAIYSLMGVAVRIAERMGLHRDADMFDLGVVRSEERRRIWWQLQYMEIAIARLVGSLSMTLYAGWDTKPPANLDDEDLHRPGLRSLPVERTGLTSMSHCLWRYSILHMQRENMRQPGGMPESLSWLLSPQVSIDEKDVKIDAIESALGAKFLQHCELLNPLHVYIQIGIRQFLLAARRTARQPALVNAKILEMTQRERDDFLEICTKGLDYYLMSQTTESLKGYQWHNENYFQWPSFVYIILEAHHRFDNDRVTDLWTLIRRIYDIHPELSTASRRTEAGTVARITLAAWQRHDAYIRQRQANVNESYEPPQWIGEMCQNFNLPQPTATSASGSVVPVPAVDASQLLPADFDFDVFDWAAWDETYANTNTGSGTV
ncbi:hypothetical protein LTS07_004232 [Exophiala sideris]|uniref:Xylanolytic transcriptional activator regulatory domain-containing protein n=1 Tax=Exophiala sideris TaxID=1016849 RepID=A0ABR0JEG1_9EURO|nr:hypothetical protein LTS07_004232 [Exophiala sideris]KAK5062346.1 hypothetical protein LTR69_004704 [Exophiala sideris]KAK5177504.1 hypothetical protein LTR44_009914 [Eurotiomycetes sp. CCFEE 6388]